MNVGHLIRAYRKAKGITAKELADMAGIAQSSVSDIENNKTSPSVDTLNKILNALGLSLSDFFSTDEELSPDLLQLIETAKKLTPEERRKLTDLLQTILKRMDNHEHE